MRADKFIEELTKVRQRIIDNKNDGEPEIYFNLEGDMNLDISEISPFELWDRDYLHIEIRLK